MKWAWLILCTLLMTACQNQNTPNSPTNDSPPIKACTKDLKSCDNGRSVGRNAENNCEFHSCESLKQEPMICTQEVKQCADGTYVGRDPYNKCEFSICPKGDLNLQ